MFTTPLKPKNQQIATLLAFSLIPMSGFATDIYIPSLPTMAQNLGVSQLAVQLTLGMFLISYGVSQLFVGSLLDSFGRYRINLISLLIFAVASIVIANTANIYIIYAMRIVHGITVGAIVVSKRAYFVDVYKGDQLKNYLSMFSIIWATAPIVAPFVGGYLQNYFGWQANFYFLALFAVTILILELIFSGETIKQPMVFSLKKIASVYSSMIGTASFTLGIVMLGLSYSMVMVYNMTGPFIIEHELGLSPITAGYCSLLLGGAVMLGGFLGKATINKPFVKKLSVNLLLQCLFCLTMFGSVFFVENLYSMVFFAFIIHASSGYTFNTFFTFCLSRFPKNAGIASGLTGGINYVIVSFLSYGIIAAIPAKDQLNLTYSYAVLIILSLATMFIIFKQYNKAVKG
ncbi:MFS transporter [Pedobacter insulae]|uniref:Drug resistance transporter, Bcr/CflA subfamily n=1 Tax=Pedobacter insulae TaxID=414048 RepID=A0A1I2WHY1_9SPHI|nr:MFS transporter [Pedobacter insulae]SFH00888.1 drug resistance transporter, Bcr/CflA subfamily [Pedobacter insulae]